MKNFGGIEWLDWRESSGEIQAISDSLKAMANYGATVTLPPDKIGYISEALSRHEMNTSKLLGRLDDLLGGEE